jgi:hypothetical protein
VIKDYRKTTIAKIEWYLSRTCRGKKIPLHANHGAVIVGHMPADPPAIEVVGSPNLGTPGVLNRLTGGRLGGHWPAKPRPAALAIPGSRLFIPYDLETEVTAEGVIVLHGGELKFCNISRLIACCGTVGFDSLDMVRPFSTDPASAQIFRSGDLPYFAPNTRVNARGKFVGNSRRSQFVVHELTAAPSTV